MKKTKYWGQTLAGAAAGSVNGLFGAGGGMVLVPLLTAAVKPSEEELFPTSVCIMLPLCLVSLGITSFQAGLPWQQSWPYLAGSAIGGLFSGWLGQKIPALWLHRCLGILILWGGVRYLC